MTKNNWTGGRAKGPNFSKARSQGKPSLAPTPTATRFTPYFFFMWKSDCNNTTCWSAPRSDGVDSQSFLSYPVFTLNWRVTAISRNCPKSRFALLKFSRPSQVARSTKTRIIKQITCRTPR